MPKFAKSAISGGQPALAFVAMSSSQALIHGPPDAVPSEKVSQVLRLKVTQPVTSAHSH